MNKTCKGCGIKLQNENTLLEGYTVNLNNELCERCFRLKHYGEYKVVARSNEDYVSILRSVNRTKDLVLYIVDLLNIPRDLNYIREYLNNQIILVLNKRDVLPKSVKDEKIINYLKELGLDFLDIVIISTKNNYNLDLLLSKIKKYKTSKNVYVVGHTNVGKSSLINSFIRNYSESREELTISPLPSTTLNKIEIEINKNLTIIDTPGLIDNNSIINYVDFSMIKRLNPKKEIKPKTYQIKPHTSLVIDPLVRVDYTEGEKNSFTFYISNDLKIKRFGVRKNYMKDLYKVTIDTKYGEDIVINGLGWIKIVAPAKIDLYLSKNVEVFVRKSII